MNNTGAEPAGTDWPVYYYFVAVMVFSAPFWLVGLAVAWEPLPGLPASSLMIVVPGVVAFAFVARVEGRHQAIRWLSRALRLPPLTRSGWLMVAVSLPPAILFAAYLGMLLVGYQLPKADVNAASALLLLAIFFIPAAFEELGWSCFALVALQHRMSALRASLILGTVWAIWHMFPLLQVGRSMEWIAWWSLGTVASRVLTTWIFNNASRIAIPVALFHASENSSWQSFPVHGSHYEPAFHALMLWGACAVIIVWFGGKALTLPGRRTDR